MSNEPFKVGGLYRVVTSVVAIRVSKDECIRAIRPPHTPDGRGPPAPPHVGFICPGKWFVVLESSLTDLSEFYYVHVASVSGLGWALIHVYNTVGDLDVNHRPR